jgi:shikimate dehydrogenase
MSSGRLRVGLIGDPVAHSISPSMQQPALDALGISATFELWHTLAADLPARIASLRAPDVLGANVTVPHKLGVMDHLDEVSPLARRAGAVNVIVHREGHLSGDNTDIHGFAVSLEEACPNARVRPALVLGAGGAARAAVWALASSGTQVTVWNRTARKAAALATELGVEAATRPGPAELLVNATSVGLRADDSLDGLPLVDARVVVDLVYGDAPTPIARWAEERGARLVDGREVLVRQGARSLAVWTGREAPLEAMRRAVVHGASSTSAQV